MKKFKLNLILECDSNDKVVFDLYPQSKNIKDIIIMYIKNGLYNQNATIVCNLWNDINKRYEVIPYSIVVIENSHISFNSGLKEHVYKCNYTLCCDDIISKLQMGFTSNFDFKIFSLILKSAIKNTSINYTCFAKNRNNSWQNVISSLEKE